ncbi:MAG: fimbrial protein [Parabacteroides gordonii]|nr:fimbrial protein [Parabacteroides gordonii]
MKYKLSCLAASLLLAACTSENTLDTPTPPDQGGASDNETREVLLTLKNKLKVTPVETKAGPIATADENHIYSLDVYVFGSKTEGGPYTFQEQFYYREDARQTVAGDYATSFTLNAGADNSTALLRMKKGLYVKIYCIANGTTLIDPATDAEFTGFQALVQSAPGQPANTVTPGIPTEDEFKTLHTPVLKADEPTDILTTPLPMTGAYTTPLDLTDFSVSARTQLGFKLTRMVARFDVENDASLSRFTIESVSMGNGRTGATYFPVKVLGTEPADNGNLITYPAREYTALQTAAKPKGLGIFYCYPSPVGDDGYLILSGTYAANKTENIKVSYKVPFKPAGDDTGNYIEVAHNHRYTISITSADPYHLDFTLQVDDWTDEGNVDNYKPENDFTREAFTFDAANSTNALLLSDGKVALEPAAGNTLKFTMASNSEIEESLDYAGGDEWLVADGDRLFETKASGSTAFAYKMADDLGSMSDFRPVTINLVNKASGNKFSLIVMPKGQTGPTISLVVEEGNTNTYNAATRTVTILNANGQTIKLKATAATLGTEAATTGSSVAITNNWITVDSNSAADAEGVYTFTLPTAQGSADATNMLTFTATATSAETVVNVVLKAPQP